VEDKDLKVRLLSTFHDHYGAILIRRSFKGDCVLQAVPRTLSSSCGTCAVTDKVEAERIKEVAGDHLEAIYQENGEGRYEKLS